MKKRSSILIICISLILILPGLSQAERFGIKLTGGINYLEVGDPNASLKGFSDLMKDLAIFWGVTGEGEIEQIHSGLDLEGDVIFYLSPRFGISLGSGYIHGNKVKDANKVILSGLTYAYGMKMSAIPVRLGIYYSLPMSSRIRIFLNGGVGYYFAKWSESIDWMASTTDQETKASGIGFHGGVGLEFKLVSPIAFILEGQGRHVKIGGFEGKKLDFIEGTLNYYESQILGNWYPKVDIIDGLMPIGIRNLREAKVDFSGFTFRAGIKINF
jgi:opacity protein-like surface antigen